MRQLSWVPAAVLLTALTWVPAATAVTGSVSLRAYNSGNSSERAATVPLDPTYPYTRVGIYCIDLGTPPGVGEILDVKAEVEVTNDLRYKVMWQTQIVLTDSCSTAQGGTEITEANGFNLLYDMHHGTATKAGTLTITTATSRRFVVLQSLAKPLLGAPYEVGDALTVESDYGRLSVLRWS